MPARVIRSQLTPDEGTMWQLYTTFRFGDYKTQEIDLTPALGIGLIVGVFGLIVRTGL